jgi:hypothetical protein
MVLSTTRTWHLRKIKAKYPKIERNFDKITVFLITTYLFQFVSNQLSLICRQIVKLFLKVHWSPFTVARALLLTQTGVPGAGKGGRMRCKPGASTRGAVVDLISSYCQIQDTCAKQVHIKQSKWCWYGQEYRVHDRLEVPGACRQEYLVHGRAEVPGACSQEYLVHGRAEVPYLVQEGRLPERLWRRSSWGIFKQEVPCAGTSKSASCKYCSGENVWFISRLESFVEVFTYCT